MEWERYPTAQKLSTPCSENLKIRDHLNPQAINPAAVVQYQVDQDGLVTGCRDSTTGTRCPDQTSATARAAPGSGWWKGDEPVGRVIAALLDRPRGELLLTPARAIQGTPGANLFSEYCLEKLQTGDRPSLPSDLPQKN